MAFRLISRPLTDTPLFVATTKCSSRLKKFDRWKKLPLKVNVNGSIGKPAGPTVAPGGSAAVRGLRAPARSVAGRRVASRGRRGQAAGPRKSTRVPLAAPWSW